MRRFLIRRLAHLLLVLWGALTMVFALQRLGGDPVTLLLPELSTPQQRTELRAELGLDRPMAVQYLRFMWRAAQGDFGISYKQQRPVTTIVLERLPATLKLSLLAVLVATVMGVAAGVAAAVYHGRFLDRLVISLAVLGQSVPTFWLGILAILVFAVQLHWLPSAGDESWRHLILPAFTLGTFSLARTARLARSSMLDVLRADYVRTARAKGMRNSRVILVHALKNASISVVTVTAYTFSTLIGGAVVTEAIFAWPGIGSLIVESVLGRDFPLVQGAIFMTAFFVAGANAVVDIVYSFLDPRIAYR